MTVRAFRMHSQDGSEFWQGRFVLLMGSGAWLHGVTLRPHTSEDEAERDALTLASAKQTKQ